MNSSKAELLHAVETVRGVSLLVVGDLMLDRYIWGEVERISPEAPVPVVQVTSNEQRLGGAGNVVRNLCRIGASVAVAGFVGGDAEGEAVMSLLDSYGVNKDGVMVDRTAPTCTKTRVIAHRQQVVRVDSEGTCAQSVALQEALAAVVESQLDSVRGVIVSDYAKGCICQPLLRRFHEAYQAGRLSVAERPLVVDPKRANYEQYKQMSLATPNRREAETASGVAITDKASAVEAAKTLLTRWNAEMMMITLGADGMLLYSPDFPEGYFLDAVAREVFDVTGAGDTVIALFAAAMAAGIDLRMAGEFANIGAGVVVSEVGTAEVTPEKLIDEINRIYQ